MNPPLIELLYKALRSPVGIVVASDNPEKLRQKLYAERRNAEDPDLSALSFTVSRTSPETELWIVKTNGSREEDS